MKSDVPSILRLADIRGRTILGLYGLGTSLVAILNLNGLHQPLWGVVALLFMWGALVTLAMNSEEPFGRIHTIVVVVLGVAMAVVSAGNIAVFSPGYATWHLGAAVMLSFVLALRGRTRIAWFGFGIVAVVQVVAAVSLDMSVVATVNDVARQAGTLFVGSLFALFLSRASRTIAAIQRTQLSRAAVEASRIASEQERDLQLSRLERDARPALDRILSPEPLADEEQLQFAVLESSLRDGIRAAGFSGQTLAEETRLARQRGIQVVLLDDRGSGLDDAQRESVEAALVEQLQSTRNGAVTARLSPNDRDELATIVVEDGGRYHRVVVTESGVEVTHLS
jgi:hypothetical protein